MLNDIHLRRFGYAVKRDDDPRLRVPPDPGWEGIPLQPGVRLRQLETRSRRETETWP